jgi:hypothetical protein
MALTALRICPLLILHLASVLPKRKNTSSILCSYECASASKHVVYQTGYPCPVNDCAQHDGLKNIKITYTTLLFASMHPLYWLGLSMSGPTPNPTGTGKTL